MENQPVGGSGTVAAAQSVIVDGTRDVAWSVALDKMMTEAAGRKPFQQVYLWTTSEDDQSGKKKATTIKYNVAEDGPAHEVPSKLPTQEELTPGPRTKLYLEVGIVIGSQPDKYKPVGLSRNKAKEEEREMRGVLPRDETAMRAFTPIADSIARMAKFYVGCREHKGRLYPRVIEVNTIFFYPEFWAEVDPTKPAKQRMSALMTVCRRHAAINKTAAPHPPLDKIDNTELDYEKDYNIRTKGLTAFHDFNTPLTLDNATLVATELKVYIHPPTPSIPPPP